MAPRERRHAARWTAWPKKSGQHRIGCGLSGYSATRILVLNARGASGTSSGGNRQACYIETEWWRTTRDGGWPKSKGNAMHLVGWHVSEPADRRSASIDRAAFASKHLGNAADCELRQAPVARCVVRGDPEPP